MSNDGTNIAISTDVTEVALTESNVSINVVPSDTSVVVEGDAISIDINPTVVTVEAKGMAISTAPAAAQVSVSPTGTITATNLQDALGQLADQDFRTEEAPTGYRIEVGDTWYDTNDDQLKIYRQTSNGVYEWVPIMIGNDSEDSDNIDAGAF